MAVEPILSRCPRVQIPEINSLGFFAADMRCEYNGPCRNLDQLTIWPQFVVRETRTADKILPRRGYHTKTNTALQLLYMGFLHNKNVRMQKSMH